jgi:hypothetical protein
MEQITIKEFVDRNMETPTGRYLLEGEAIREKSSTIATSDGHEAFLIGVNVQRPITQYASVRMIVDEKFKGDEYLLSSYDVNSETRAFIEGFESHKDDSLTLEELAKEMDKIDNEIQRRLS